MLLLNVCSIQLIYPLIAPTCFISIWYWRFILHCICILNHLNFHVCIIYQTSSYPTNTNVILSLCKRVTFCICICFCFCCCIRIMTTSSMFPFAGRPLCFYWLSACVGPHEEREGQAKAKGDLLFEKWFIISCFSKLYVKYVAQVICFWEIVYYMLTFKIICEICGPSDLLFKKWFIRCWLSKLYMIYVAQVIYALEICAFEKWFIICWLSKLYVICVAQVIYALEIYAFQKWFIIQGVFLTVLSTEKLI